VGGGVVWGGVWGGVGGGLNDPDQESPPFLQLLSVRKGSGIGGEDRSGRGQKNEGGIELLGLGRG